jgi:hypothetical protein
MSEKLSLIFVNHSGRRGDLSIYLTPPEQTPSITSVATQSKPVHPRTTVMLTWSRGSRAEDAASVCWLTFGSATLQIDFAPGITSMTAVLDENDQWTIGPASQIAEIVNDHDRDRRT